MSNYKQKVCKTFIDKSEKNMHHEPKTIDEVYEEIQNTKIQRSKHLNYKERMEKNMQKSMYLMEDLHEQLCEYWQSFGFLSKSTSQGFAKALLPTIRVYHHHNITLHEEPEEESHTGL